MPTDEYYVKYVEKCWTQWEDAMRPVHKLDKELWQLYQNKQDWSDKQSWQSKCFIPKIMMQVEKAAGEVKRAVLGINRLFKFRLDDSQEAEQIQRLQEAGSESQDPREMAAIQSQIQQIRKSVDVRKSRMQVRESQFRRKLSESNFANIYSEMVKGCMLLGRAYPKLVYRDGFLFENPEVSNVAVSPEYIPHSQDNPPYLIERMEMDLAEFKRRVREQNKGLRGNDRIWNPKVIKDIEEDAKRLDEFTDRRRRLGLGDYSRVNKKVELKYFWGDVVDEDNNKVETGKLLVVVNGRHLARNSKNPFDHGKTPYVPTIPMVYPHRGTHGISLVAPQVRLQYTMNNIVNMILDNLAFSVTKMFQYNPQDLENPGGMHAIYPGKTFAHNLPAGQQAIQEVSVTPIKRDALYTYELLDRESQEGTGVTEFISGLPGKKSKTLGEIEMKTAQSKGIFDTIARDLELNSLKPLLEMAYDLCVQFEGWEPREGNYGIEVSGLTVMLQQRELREQINETIEAVVAVPQFAQMSNLQALWKRFLASRNLSDVFVDPGGGGIPLDNSQTQVIAEKAQADAKQAVGRMSPQEIIRFAGNASSAATGR